MRVERLYRYPVKGLTPEALDEAAVEEGGCLPWDRAFALAQGDASFDPARPEWLRKGNFMCLMKNAAIAALRSSFDPARGRLVIRAPDGTGVDANALTEAGRARIGAWLARFLGAEARGEPRFHHVPGHSFCDQRRKVVSLINLASLADFQARVGMPREKRRFRANLYFSSTVPWAELKWIGSTLAVGGARLLVVKPISRCPATEVNPATAIRDADPVAELRALYGHINLGVHAEVIEGGMIAVGDGLRLSPG
jgi:uncharacterized protein YcbX